MSYKENIKAEVEVIVAKGHDIEAKIIETVKTDFTKILSIVEKSGTSLKNATYETLEGIEEGLKASGQKTEDILKKSADTMLEVTKKSSEEAIAKSREAAQKSKDALDNEITKVKDEIADVNASVKERMHASYADFREKTETEKAYLQDVADGLKEYSAEKSHLLSESIDKTKDAINEANTSFENHSKALLHHSEERIAAWYNSLIKEIKKYV